MRLEKYLIPLFIIGLIIFTVEATFHYGSWSGNYIWGRSYDLWHKTIVMVLTFHLWRTSKERNRFGGILFPVFGLACLRVIWASISWYIGLDMNNIKWVGALFTLCCLYILICCICILYKSLKNGNN